MWSLHNNSTESPVNSASSSVTSVDSYVAGQNRAAAAVREKPTTHTRSEQQATPTTEDLEYLVAYTRPTNAPEPITHPFAQGMHFGCSTPTQFQKQHPQYVPLNTQGSASTIDLEEPHGHRSINVHGFTGFDSAHPHSSEGNIASCGPENSCTVHVESHSENGEASAQEILHNLAKGPKKIHSVGTTAEDGILNDASTSPPKPKPTIANLLRRGSCNLTPRRGALKRILSFIPRWLSHRLHKRKKTCDPVVTSNDAGGGKTRNE